MNFITLLSNIIISIIAYILTNQSIPLLSNTLISAGLKGKDLLKAHLIGGGGFPISASLIKPNPINLKSTN
ncbi:hypothetical protein DFH28DRAFT_989092 [Melampsora americana]|nr:hypothetical protein DFH28DRAFT_989092 [Melampsora americana]